MAMRVAIMFVQALLLMLQYHIAAGREFHVSNTYYIQHYNGRCLEYDGIRQILFYGRVCREKFEWQEGARLIHIPTKKCVTVNSTSDGTFLSLASQCSGTNSLFQYDHSNRVISHLSSNKCLHPADGGADPIANTGVVLKTGCDKNTNKYYFRETTYFVIRHIGGLCWVHDSNQNIVRLHDKVACDRFEYVNDKLLRHVETGKCVIFSNSYIRLTDDCRSAQPMFGDEHSLLHYGVSQCVQPASVALSPPVNNALVLLNTCINEDRLRFYFYDDKDVLKVKVISESCDDIPASTTCAAAKGHVIVNGRQYSPSTRGINVVIFDYRSGLFEHSKAYDVLGYPGPRDDLANFLNSLTAGKILFLTGMDAVNLNANLALALQKVGVSATFATTPVPKERSSLAYIGYTGQQRKGWEKSLNRLGGEGGSTIEATINSFVDRDGINDCSNELGVRTRKIADSRFYARTTWFNDFYHKPFQARLHLKTNGWCSQGHVPVSDYLQVDLGITKLITGLALQGHGLVLDHSITKFKIEFSENGESWQFYKNDQNLVEEFPGLRKVHMLETRVNWFRNLKTRFIRVVPTARTSVVNCLRIELYGCSVTRSFLSVQWPSRTSQQIDDNYKGSITTFGTIKENLTVGISIAANNNSLATTIEQVHFNKMNASTTLDNGTLVKNSGEVKVSTDQKRKIDSAAFTEFDIKKENYYLFTVDFTGKILDAGLPTGDRCYVMTLESRYGILAYAKPLTIKRLQPDRSILQFNVTNENLQPFVADSYLHLNLSVSHSAVASHSNAYAVSIMIYFNSEFLEFKTLAFENQNRFSLEPSRNKTGNGFIMIQTDTLWLLNSQQISVVLQVKIHNAIAKGENFIGNIIIDFSYRNNLRKFSGTVNSTLEKLMPFKCKIEQGRDVTVPSVRLPPPEFSMVYDEAHGQFIYCNHKKIERSKDSFVCYSQRNDSASWKSIPYVSAVMGIDVEKKTVYALDIVGKSYAMSSFPYTNFDHVEDSKWIVVKDLPQLQMSLKSDLLSSLPSSISNSWTLSVGGKPFYAATSHGILKKSGDLSWKSVVSWK